MAPFSNDNQQVWNICLQDVLRKTNRMKQDKYKQNGNNMKSNCSLLITNEGIMIGLVSNLIVFSYLLSPSNNQFIIWNLNVSILRLFNNQSILSHHFYSLPTVQAPVSWLLLCVKWIVKKKIKDLLCWEEAVGKENNNFTLRTISNTFKFIIESEMKAFHIDPYN